MKTIKQKVLSGELVYGCWINLGSLPSTEIVGRSGYDWVLIDLEHGAGNDATMYHQLQVLENIGATAIVRTDGVTRGKVQRILDAGAGGIMFPQLQGAAEADEAIRLMYYPPRGTRGMAKMVRAMGFGAGAQTYIADLESNIIGIIQIETLPAMREIDAIAATPGVDVLFVGPSDLSLAYGIFGQLQHPVYQNAIREVAAAAKKHGKVAGVLLQNPDEHEMYYALGYRFLACGADGTFVAKGAEELLKKLKKKSVSSNQ